MEKGGSVFGGTLLVAGTCIGAGMLALPILTGLAGFWPSTVVYVLSWLVMCATGLLFLEICLWLEKDVNIVSMARQTLGPVGKWFAWIVYLYLFYSLTVAYVSGGGSVVGDLVDDAISPKLASLIFVIVFGPWVYFGARAVDKTNLMLVVGMAVAYVAFLIFGASVMDVSLLQRMHWNKLTIAIPVIITSFGYQGFVPTLTSYLARDPKRVRRAIIIGSFIPLVAYIAWEFLILGILPEDALTVALDEGHTAVHPLRHAVESRSVFIVGEFFAFFALTSSFLGVTLGLRDFLADGLHVVKDRTNRLWLCLAIFVPALMISWTDPRLFILALQYGGGIGVSLLLGLLPITMVWVGRYHHKMRGPYRLPGGRPLLSLLAIIFLGALAAIIYPWTQ